MSRNTGYPWPSSCTSSGTRWAQSPCPRHRVQSTDRRVSPCLPTASCGYFGARPAGLSWPQAATLAGLVQGPSLDDPLTHPANARAREMHVVGRLVATGKLTPAQGRAALAVPLRSLLARAGQGCSRSA